MSKLSFYHQNRNELIQHICFAPKNSRRAKYWSAALPHSCQQYSYIEVMNNCFTLQEGVNYYVRIESPGECEATTQFLIELGGGIYQQAQFGEFTNFDAWYKGWQIVLKKLNVLSTRYNIRFINSPEAIALVFDKLATHRYLQNKSDNIHLPKLFGTIRSYSELKQLLELPSYQVFLKPRYGSSASGVIALRTHQDKLVAYTSLTQQAGKVFNSLQLKRYTKWKQLQEIFNLTNNEFLVEQWLPKLTFHGSIVDFRVIVIGGKAEFLVPRLSKHPITNIHLGNKKGSPEQFPPHLIKKIESFSENIATYFPNLKYSGMDVLLDTNEKPHLLEVNAFGDLLLNVKNKQGFSTYQKEVELLYL